MSKPLKSKVALVTGAGRGIGRAIAVAFGKAGAAVSCVARTTYQVESTAAQILKKGGQAIAITADVTRLSQVERAVVHTAETFGGLDILVINAGGNFDRKLVENSDTDHWAATIELNLIGAYYCARSAIPYLKRRGTGKIITVGSGLGHHGRSERSAYACSKAGLWMLTRVLAQELWSYNISVNELIPGPVATDLSSPTPSGKPAEGQSEWLKKPEDVGPLALFLATQPDIGPSAQSFSLMRRDT